MSAIKTYFTGDTSDLEKAHERAGRKLKQFYAAQKAGADEMRHGYDSAKRSVDRFKEVAEFGKSLLAIAGITTVFRSLVEHANSATGEIDENTKAVKRFGQAFSELKKGAMDAGVSLLGTLNSLGEAIGDGINRLTKSAEDLQRLDAAGSQGIKLDAQEKALKDRAVREAAIATGRKQADLEHLKTSELIAMVGDKRRKAEMEAVAAEQAARRKAGEERAKVEADLAAAQNKAFEQSATDEEKLQKLMEERERLQANYATVVKATGENSTEALRYQTRLIENQTRLTEAKTKVEEAAADAQREAMEKSKAKLEEQKKLQEEADRKALETQEKIGQLMERQTATLAEQNKIREDAEKAQTDRSGRSLTEIAAGEGDTRSSDKAAAKKVLRLEDRAARAQDRGNFDKAEELRSQADKARQGITNLKSSERDPSANFKEAMKTTEDELKTITQTMAELKANAAAESD